MDIKSFEGFISCGVCFDIFDLSNKRPRVLICGHSFCHSCLEIILLQRPGPCCPNCKANIMFDSVQSIPVNFSLESMISLRRNADHSYKEIKKQVSLRIENELRTILESLKDLDSERNELKAKFDYLKQLQTVAKSTQSDVEISKAMKDLDRVLQKGKMPIIEDLEYLSFLSIENLETWCREKPIYAKDEQGDSPLYGKVTVKEGSVWISSFKPVNPQSWLIPFKNILSRLMESTELPRTGFLQLTPKNGGGQAFNIVIKTRGLCPRAKNFILLCSALKGFTYKGLNMKKNNSPYYCLFNPGPPSVVEGIRNDEFGSRLKEADVWGMGDNKSWFEIQLRDDPSDHPLPKFGFVVAGLQSLKDRPKGKCSITECGLVI